MAKLAGLPKPVIARAEEMLEILEQGEAGGALTRLADDLPLFSAARRPTSKIAPPPPSVVEEAVKAINPDELTPKAALDLVYRLVGLSRD